MCRRWRRATAKHAHRGLDRLHHAAPATKPLLMALAEQGVNLGGATTSLLRVLDQIGAQRNRPSGSPAEL